MSGPHEMWLGLGLVGILLGAVSLLAWPRSPEDVDPRRCLPALRLIVAKGGELDDMDQDQRRFEAELALAAKFGFTSSGSVIDTGTRLTEKGLAYLDAAGATSARR